MVSSGATQKTEQVMKIDLSQAGKRFNREWIFRNATIEFQQYISYAITGPNGSGKSTLLQCIAGMMQLSEGTIEYANGNPAKGGTGSQLANEHAYKHVSFCAPYLELIEEMTLVEFLNFHSGFKNFLPGVDTEKIIGLLDLWEAAGKQIRYYSSGMKQRVKLAQAIFSNTVILLLDEPCSNLDVQGIELYHSLINDYCKERLVIVSSNDEVEYKFTNERINILDYK
jgi:ABC-type multidrug transport system ATPase subunit